MAPKLLTAAVCAAFCALAAGARADLYRWVDAQGRVHVTDDASQIPRGANVTVDPTRKTAPVPAAAGDDPGPAAPPRKSRAAYPTDDHQSVLALEPVQPKPETITHILRFQRAGQEISLDATLSDRVHCDFKVDTGASINTIPAWAVKELGLDIDADTPTI